MAYATKIADVEQCVGAVLHRAPAITAYCPTLDPDAEFPCITFQRVGGALVSEVPAVYEGARVQIDGWGDDAMAAWDLISDAFLRLLQVQGVVNDLDGAAAFVVSGVESSLMPRWNPEPGSSRARYTGEVRVYVRAA